MMGLKLIHVSKRGPMCASVNWLIIIYNVALSGVKPLFEPVMTYGELDTQDHNSMSL